MKGLEKVVFNIKEDQLLFKSSEIEVWQIGFNSLPAFVRCVFGVYSHVYLERYGSKLYENDYEKMLEEDKLYFSDSVYIGIRLGRPEIIGTIKVSRKTDLLFPIETDFNINIRDIIREKNMKVCDFWHSGRLAIDKELLHKIAPSLNSLTILNYLLVYGFGAIVQGNIENVMITEVDSLVYKMLRSRGVGIENVGKGKFYLGSMTYASISAARDLKRWIDKTILD